MLAKWRYRRMRPDDEGKRAVRAEDGTVVIACNSHKESDRAERLNGTGQRPPRGHLAALVGPGRVAFRSTPAWPCGPGCLSLQTLEGRPPSSPGSHRHRVKTSPERPGCSRGNRSQLCPVTFNQPQVVDFLLGSNSSWFAPHGGRASLSEADSLPSEPSEKPRRGR